MNTEQALRSLQPNALFSTKKEQSKDLEIIWHSTDIPQPTDAEITAEVTRLQAEYDNAQYARDRADAYPSLADQADMAYWDRQDGTTTLDDAIAAVKAEFPKP